METFHLQNTLTGKKDVFRPLVPGAVGLYVCGVTPYDEVHLGHARCYVVFDVLKRAFRSEGYEVKHIQNFTDVDDKIIERANKAGVKPADHAEKYIKSYHHWMEKLNISPADDYPRVTTHIKEVLDLIKRLEERGLAYESKGDVFFRVRKFPAYGKLSKRKLDDLESGARVEVDAKKEDPLDFALWKKSKEGEPFWDSPWGKGRPGWHIECSAMAMNFLGDKFDIHGGGQDLIFPHHENEIAQSNGATGDEKGFARFWVHNGFVTINKEKMSKSLGNFFSIKDILEKFDPMSVRYFLLTQHYRSPLNFSDEDLRAAQRAWQDRVQGALEKLNARANNPSGAAKPGTVWQIRWDKLKADFALSLRNDLNTPAALGALNQAAGEVFQVADDKAATYSSEFWTAVRDDYANMLETLGLRPSSGEGWPPDILALAEERVAARKAKDWKKSDELRGTLKSKGVLVEDTSSGQKLKKALS